EEEETSFQPTLTAHQPTRIRSHLRISQEGDTYLERVEREREAVEQRRMQAYQRQALSEMAECTFHPQTTDLPQHVRRVARQMQELRDQ
ncbi:hypothetical protein KIPB_002455, partial [Kipferlia bialata]